MTQAEAAAISLLMMQAQALTEMISKLRVSPTEVQGNYKVQVGNYNLPTYLDENLSRVAKQLNTEPEVTIANADLVLAVVTYLETKLTEVEAALAAKGVV